ncbi:hypothetical protein DXV75_01740 [Alteromonas aestuariivivens]|uniref:PEP-CTERM sorting domain-containing protein n=1 Tax=Alteromonas aestuariivivens TaxID=1938339 RepID=A0A3D8MEF5_9ALTE|nr:hypothetical protein [Alteromonas aestuariivivens]RDV29207.1 hypothetical protein DXV75_01740 [Alteromonas aestuariivivens]
MKKLLLTLALSSALSAGAMASPITLDPTMDGDLSDAIVFDELDFLQMYPSSYYVDSTQDGFVNNGEFVFDFGNNVNLGAYYLNNTQIGGSTFSGSYSLVADYLLVGTAVATTQSEVALATMAANVGLSVEDYVVAVNTATMGCTVTDIFTAPVCATIAEAMSNDGIIDGDSDEILYANITDGLFNLFLTDDMGNRLALAGSFDVSGLDSETSGGLFTLNILGETIQAAEDLLYDQYGNSFADLVADPDATNPTIRVDTNIDQSVGSYSEVPGSLQSVTVGDTNLAGNGDAGQLYYYTKDDYNAWDITAEANGAGCSLPDTDIPFGGCSGLIGDPSAADDKWDELKQLIRDAAGCAGPNASCEFDLLARQTETDASASIEASSPGSLLLSGLALLALGLRRRFA